MRTDISWERNREETMKAFSIGATVLLLTANGAAAQDASWTYSTTVYGWLSGMDTSVEMNARSIETESSFSDIWSSLYMEFGVGPRGPLQ